ncbi:hypothetical protein D3C76_1048040 [compost metagenome]
MPGDIAGHQVRGELDTRELAAETAGQRPDQQRLAQARHTFEQYVAAGKQRGQHVVDDRVLSDHGFLQFMAHGLGQLAGALALRSGVVDCIGLGRLTHNAFLKICRRATWRLNSALESRCFGRGLMAWLTVLSGCPPRRASTRHCSVASSRS